jgi:hypothetical protein
MREEREDGNAKRKEKGDLEKEGRERVSNVGLGER